MVNKFVGLGIGVIVGIPGHEGVPLEHYAVWFGHTFPDDRTLPESRTIPMADCELISHQRLRPPQ